MTELVSNWNFSEADYSYIGRSLVNNLGESDSAATATPGGPRLFADLVDTLGVKVRQSF